MIRLPRPLLKQIETAAEEAWPHECCGLLTGHGDFQVSRAVASPNVFEGERNDRFEVDPKVRLDLMRELEGTEERIVGHYHSHPGKAAVPSAHDLSMAFEPELAWLITEVQNGKAIETRAYLLDETAKRFREVALSLT